MAARTQDAYNYFKYTGSQRFCFPNKRAKHDDVVLQPDSNFGIRKSRSGKELRLVRPWSGDERPVCYTIEADLAERLLKDSVPYKAGYIPAHTAGCANPKSDSQHLLKVK
jgi:hypothetical protein